MKQLIDSIQGSIYSPGYYRDILTKPFGYSWKYFTAFSLLLAVFLTIVSSIPLIASASKILHEFGPKFFAYYPDELELTITRGHVTTTVAEPYFLPVPSEWKSQFSKNTTFENLAVIDTKTQFSLEQFDAYKSAAWIGESQVAYHDDKGSIKIEPLSKDLTITVNEAGIRTLFAKAEPYFQYVGPAITLLIFFGLLIAFGANLVYMLFGALLVLLLTRLMKHRFAYGKCYQLGLHALTLPLLVDTLLSFTGIPMTNVPFAQTLVMLAIIYFNLKDLAPLVPAEPPAPATAAIAPPPDVLHD